MGIPKVVVPPSGVIDVAEAIRRLEEAQAKLSRVEVDRASLSAAAEEALYDADYIVWATTRLLKGEE